MDIKTEAQLYMRANFTFSDHRDFVIQICIGILSGEQQECTIL